MAADLYSFVVPPGEAESRECRPGDTLRLPNNSTRAQLMVLRTRSTGMEIAVDLPPGGEVSIVVGTENVDVILRDKDAPEDVRPVIH